MTLLSRKSKIEVNVAKKEIEFAVELHEQIEELREAIDEFDNGKLRKAKNISNTINMLVSDAGSNRSLLKKVGILNKLRFRVAKTQKINRYCYG